MSGTPDSPSAHDRAQRRRLIGIALMFFAPLAVAFILYYGHIAWRPVGTVNAGRLIDPPRPLPPLALDELTGGQTNPNFLKRKWTLLYVDDGLCAEACRRHLYDTRQVRIALDREMDRVQRVFIAGTDCCDRDWLKQQHPDLITARLDASAAPLLTLLPGGAQAAKAQRIYIIDPLGNLMMSYEPEARPKGLLEDMKRLLRLSSIG